MVKFIVACVVFCVGVYCGALWSETHPTSKVAIDTKNFTVGAAKKTADVATAAGSAGYQAATKKP